MYRFSLLFLGLFACSAEPSKEATSAAEDSGEPAFPPVTVESTSFSPDPPYTNDTLVLTTVFAGGDPAQTVSALYEWYVIDAVSEEDETIQTGTQDQLMGVSFFDRDDQVYVIVKPSEGSPYTTPTVTVSNTPPSVVYIGITPEIPMVGQDELRCTINLSSTDDDMDIVRYTYQWTDGAGEVQQLTESTTAAYDVLSADKLTVGTWQCEVTPDDGSLTAPSATASVEVGG